MKLPLPRFNTFLGCALLAGALAGCASGRSGGKGKEATALRCYLEADWDGGARTAAVPIYRAKQIPVVVQKGGMQGLDETHLVDARVVDVVGGFAIQVRFDFHGTLALESYSAANRGKRVVIVAQWTEQRSLAAPQMNAPIRDGLLTFTPDASREEADRIVHGLNNVAEKLGNRTKTKEKAPPKPNAPANEAKPKEAP